MVSGVKKAVHVEQDGIRDWNPRAFVIDFVRDLATNAKAQDIVESFLSMNPRAEDSLPAAFALDIFEDKRYVAQAVDRAFSSLGIPEVSTEWWQDLPKAYINSLVKVINMFWENKLGLIVEELATQLGDEENEVKDFILEMSPGDISIYTDESKPDKEFK